MFLISPVINKEREHLHDITWEGVGLYMKQSRLNTDIMT